MHLTGRAEGRETRPDRDHPPVMYESWGPSLQQPPIPERAEPCPQGPVEPRPRHCHFVPVGPVGADRFVPQFPHLSDTIVTAPEWRPGTESWQGFRVTCESGWIQNDNCLIVTAAAVVSRWLPSNAVTVSHIWGLLGPGNVARPNQERWECTTHWILRT